MFTGKPYSSVLTYNKWIRLWGKRSCACVDAGRGKLSWHNRRGRGGRQAPNVTTSLMPTCRLHKHSKRKKSIELNSTANASMFHITVKCDSHHSQVCFTAKTSVVHTMHIQITWTK